MATVPTSADGEWQIVIELQGTEPITLLAVVTDPDGLVLTSEPVTLILAPPVHPNTGMDRVVDSDQTGRAFTALLALLLVAGGFSTFFAGRLIYLLAKDRLKPR
ncbi:MAG: hypothetical protein HY866_21145 [Chloroflexi bacterium]|nr:hypothetical protein [Chloroflexota bacterium]